MKTLKKIWVRDWLLNVILIYIIISDVLILVSIRKETIVFAIPFVFLTAIFLPFFLLLFFPCVIIYDTGIKIKNKMLKWNEIRSISFSSGRFKDNLFWKGLKLPATQRIYILDMKGKEYNTIIDFDHSLKFNRSKNNISKISEIFHYIGRANILSDWAEKR